MPGIHRFGNEKSRFHFPQTLVLLDLPADETTAGEPLAFVSSPRPRESRRRVVAVVAAAVVMVLVVGGSMAVRSLTGQTARSHAPFVGLAVVPQFPAVTASIPTRAATSPKARRPHTAKPAPKPVVTPTHSATPSPSPTPSAPAIVVTFRIDEDWGSGFAAEVDVTNNGSAAISGWQIVVALPQDRFTSWWNANGFMNNGVLLLTQTSWQQPLAANGGTLRVSFIVSGDETNPVACAFNGVTCR
jgi:cellulase/cellobiase CelA1